MTSTTTAPQGVAGILSGSDSQSSILTQLFSLEKRVALVTGAERGIGLEIALALAQAGAVVYCLDLAAQPTEEWLQVQQYLKGSDNGARLEYMRGDVTDQKQMWKIVEDIVAKEGRIDVCFANAGILRGAECLEYPADEFKKLIDVNVNGVLFTAQAAGRQMEKLGIRGSIVITASMSGSITNRDQHWVAYNTSKAAVVQMARSMACELGPKGIRVNSLSPGYIYTKLTRAFLDPQPELKAKWESQNPLGRLGRPDELRGVALWLAGDGSTFCTGSDIIVDGGHRAW
ncbi:sorbose reductase sou1 [Moniliophthora roreri MCA 2997]|uniref:Sorbose reductase sou1 n=1 Tax=Moniliophthora roreri (strain MCA 2997) TaxID=1381753 RepID=V2WVC4_MONRO|nr:sorbose reductase sou1 [Moniliophthora roreri MCA 2997]KAI3597793.1 sorbose reductase sou1 [Moniliophthora roreri]